MNSHIVIMIVLMYDTTIELCFQVLNLEAIIKLL